MSSAPRVDDVVKFSPPGFTGTLFGRVERVDAEREQVFVNTGTVGRLQAMSFKGWTQITGLVLGCSICGFFDGEHDGECPDAYGQCDACGGLVPNEELRSGMPAAGVEGAFCARCRGSLIPRCGQCDTQLIDNPTTDNTLPFYCSVCNILYDWEDLN